MKIDLTTGDVITPRSIEYPFPKMFEDGTVSVMSYPLATCIAEKFESIVKRGVLTTRARDLYDIERFMALYEETFNWDAVAKAIENTAEHRGSLELMKDFERVRDEMLESNAINSMWDTYASNNSFALGLELASCIDAVRAVGRRCVHC